MLKKICLLLFSASCMGFVPEIHHKSMLGNFFNANYSMVYGWVEPSFNVSSAANSNLPTGFLIYPNQVEMNQLAIAMQKSADTKQNTHNDVGFKIVNWWGGDYRFSTMQGIFSQQLYQENLQYGFDMPEAYVELYFPHLGQGSLITIGRFQAKGDIESLFANDNYLVSHSMPYIVSAFTQFGANINTVIDKNWSYILGIHAGSDIAPWGGAAKPTLMGFLQWNTDDLNDAVLFGINSLNNGQYKAKHDNLQQINAIWTHRCSEQLLIKTEGYYEYQFNAYTSTTKIPGYSASVALLNYVEYSLDNDKLISFRADYLNDFQGQRTGYATQYIGGTIGITKTFGTIWKVRPEVRYVAATNATPFDNGSKMNLIMGIIDFVVLI